MTRLALFLFLLLATCTPAQADQRALSEAEVMRMLEPYTEASSLVSALLERARRCGVDGLTVTPAQRACIVGE